MLTLIVICGLFCCLFIAFIFSLMKAGRKADIQEEKISLIMSQKTSHIDESHDAGKLYAVVTVQK